MPRHLSTLMVFAASLCLTLPSAPAQLAGSRAGVDGTTAGTPDLPLLDRKTAETYIAIDGRAEVRVPPTEIRIVMAVTSEAATARECQEAIDKQIDGLKGAWTKIDIRGEHVVVDFIAVLPRYQWQVEEQSGVEVGVENKVGYRMQTNVHLAVPDEAKAREALTVAFEQNVTDIIAFDYWNHDLDEAKRQAREEALQAVRRKADVLLAAAFEERPRAINVQEATNVRYPESLYHSFTNAVADDVTPAWRRDIPFIRAARPRNTYYRGNYPNADIQPGELPMRPEISVVSTVRLYFESPAATRAGGRQDEEDAADGANDAN
jgi:uncharacterized protein YggE